MALYLTDDALEALEIAPNEIADAIEAALIEKAEGRLHVAPKAAILPGDGRYMMATLAVGDLTVVKQVTVSPDNPTQGLPAINGAIMALDAETGLLRAAMGANWITAHRTAALSAVAARRLADPGACTIAFVGCGVQAKSHLLAFRSLFPLSKVNAFGRGSANVDALCAFAEAFGLTTTRASTPEEALTDADIVVTSVTLDYSIAPFLDAGWLKPTAFAAITDLCIPWLQNTLSEFGSVFIDDMEQEEASEKPMLSRDLVSGDLTGLVTSPPEVDQTRPRAFAFRGIALGDYAAARLALQKAEETGAGQRMG